MTSAKRLMRTDLLWRLFCHASIEATATMLLHAEQPTQDSRFRASQGRMISGGQPAKRSHVIALC